MSQAVNMVLGSGITGLAQRTKLNAIIDALLSCHIGAARPSYAEAGTLWIDNSGGVTAWLVKVYDGADDITIGTLNTTANTFTPSGQLATFANDVLSKTGSFAPDSSYYGQLVVCDATSANITGTVPLAAALVNSWFAIFKKSDSSNNTVSIAFTGGQTCDGSAAAKVLSRQGQGICVIKDATTNNFFSFSFGDTNLVSNSVSDTTPDYLATKITAANGVKVSTVNAGGNETLKLELNLDTNPGLQIISNKVSVKPGTGIVVGASGVACDVGITANKMVQLDASGKLPAVDGSQLTGIGGGIVKRTYAANSTWNKPTGLKYAEMFMYGGGAGGGSFGGAAGVAGGQSSVGAILTAKGGSPGQGPTSGGNGGTGGTGGDSRLPGGDGADRPSATSGYYQGGVPQLLCPLAVPGKTTATNTSTWCVPSGYGVGGSSNGTAADRGGGGGAGEAAYGLFTAASLASSYAVTVGQGGNGPSGVTSQCAGTDGVVIIIEYY